MQGGPRKQFLSGPHLWTYAEQLVRLSVWLVLLSVIFVRLERLFALHPQTPAFHHWHHMNRLAEAAYSEAN